MSDYVSNSEQLSSTIDHKAALTGMSVSWSLPGRPSAEARTRRPMTEDDTQNFQQVRKQGACPACRRAKKRCNPSHMPSLSRSTPVLAPEPIGHPRLEPIGSPRMETGMASQDSTHGVLVRNVHRERTRSQASHISSSRPAADYRPRSKHNLCRRSDQPPASRKRSHTDLSGALSQVPQTAYHRAPFADPDITSFESLTPGPPPAGPTFFHNNPQLSAGVFDISQIPFSSLANLPPDDWLHDSDQPWNPIHNNVPSVINQMQPTNLLAPGLTFSGTTQSGSTLQTPLRPQSDSAYQYNQHMSGSDNHRHKRARSHVGVDQANTLFNLDELPEPLLTPFDQGNSYIHDPVADLAAGDSFFDAAQPQLPDLDADILQDDDILSAFPELYSEEPTAPVPSNQATGSLFTSDELEDIAQGVSKYSVFIWNDPTPPPGCDSETVLYTSDQDLSPDGSHEQEIFLASLGTGVTTGSASSNEGKEQTLSLRPKRAGFPNDDEG